MKNGYEIASVPTEGKWFEVKPLSIDPKLFERERKNKSQEETRQLILEAFEEMNKYPEKYARNFRTMMPEKIWTSKNAAQLKEIACKLGDHNADWVEQALEWGQRIANGESWEAICNDKDTTYWYRLVVWKKGNTRRIGGSRLNYPASNVSYNGSYDGNHDLDNTIPLVVSYEE